MKLSNYQFTVGLKNPSGLSLDYILKTYKNHNLARKYVLNLGIDINNLPEPVYTNTMIWNYKGKKYFFTVKAI
jgi:hypothetical protein